jgi:hypothetical protein
MKFFGNIKSLLTMSETEAQKKNYKDDMCSICRDEYKDTDNIEKLPCGHCFHDTCITVFNRNNKCPLCRKTIDETIEDPEEEEESPPQDPRESEGFKNLPQWKKERCGYIPNQKKRKEILEIQKKNEENYKSLMSRRPEGGSGVLGTGSSSNSGDYDLNDPNDLRKLRLNRIRADKSKIREQRIASNEKRIIDEEKPIIDRKNKARLSANNLKKNIQESAKKAKEDSRKRYQKTSGSENKTDEISKPKKINKKVMWALLSDLDVDILKKVVDRMAETPELGLEVAISESFNNEQVREKSQIHKPQTDTDREKRLHWLNRLQNNNV